MSVSALCNPGTAASAFQLQGSNARSSRSLELFSLQSREQLVCGSHEHSVISQFRSIAAI
jgi:hypothetical protein